MFRSKAGFPALFLLSLLSLLAPSALRAIEGRLLLPGGAPASGYQVSVVGQTVSVTTDREGRFRIFPDPPFPFLLVATGPAGEVSAPMEVPQPEAAGEIEIEIPPVFKDSVTVAAGVAPNIESPPAAATAVIGQEDLEQRQPPRLADTLVGIAGISRTDETSTAVPVIRGLGRGRTLILLDGARVTTERRAGASASYLDPFTLGTVEVSRGPGSMAYGSDAFGGVVHARSRYPEPGSSSLNFQIGSELGAGNEETVGLEASHDVPGGALLGQLTWRRSDENQEAGGGEIIPDSFYEDRGGALRYTSYTPAGRLQAGFTVADAYDVGKPASDSNVVHTIYPRESSRRFNLGLDAGPVAGFETLEFGLFFGTYRLVTDRDRAAAGTTERTIESSDVDANDGSIRVVGTRALWGGRLLTGAEVVSRFGLEAIASRETLNASGQRTSFTEAPAIEDARQLNEALFVTYDRPLAAKAMASVGLRGDHVETKNEGGFFGDRDTSHSALSGHAAITVGPFQDVTASLQVARGFRDPFLSDRYFRGPSGRGFIIGNPDLEPERSLQIDASVRWAVAGRSVALFAYDYHIDDLIERYRPERDFLFRNRGEADVQGVELEAQTALPWGLNLELATAMARGETEDGSDLADIAPLNAALTLRWGGAKGFAYTRGIFVAEDDRPGVAEVARPGYSTLEAGAGWRILTPLEIRVIGRNLTDRRYRDSADEVASLARGRSFSVGLVGKY
ncbi:MAG TPA: TonB-dependent receptor [Thermoanaerobaculia bacterium]|nr:TonB-dependent receptor [Thermoanaerobaculia bacterium]